MTMSEEPEVADVVNEEVNDEEEPQSPQAQQPRQMPRYFIIKN